MRASPAVEASVAVDDQMDNQLCAVSGYFANLRLVPRLMIIQACHQGGSSGIPTRELIKTMSVAVRLVERMVSRALNLRNSSD